MMVDTAGAQLLEPNSIAVDSTGQATVRDPAPRVLDVTRAAIEEGNAWLQEFGGEGELSEEGALRAEVLRNLITNADLYAALAISALNEMHTLGYKAGGALQDVA